MGSVVVGMAGMIVFPKYKSCVTGTGVADIGGCSPIIGDAESDVSVNSFNKNILFRYIRVTSDVTLPSLLSTCVSSSSDEAMES